ncbi:MAG TPA: hypothetical protein VN577_23515 [Terriglobales bacterium]|nr:hypothetical protein [Terriglobales bacterium]
MAVPVVSDNSEQRRETGLSLIVIGVMLWCFDALVFFMLPSGTKLGYQRPFAIIILTVLFAGLAMVGLGLHLRRE